jgi:hypothetical protein
MSGYRTRSLMMSVAEAAAGLISKPVRRQLDRFIFEEPDLERFGARVPLGVLLRSLKEEADLSAFGALATRADVALRLATLRRFHDEETREPGILEEPIAAPIFITGLPRSGTTFLQSILAEDPDNRVLRCWEVLYPYPDRNRACGRDTRLARFDRQIRYFHLLTPDLHKVHPLNGSSPQECTEVAAHVFQSLRFDSTYNVPSYRKWLDRKGHRAAYEFHKRFLQHLQHQQGARRWVLKSPDHVFALGALKSTYPDARIVFMHRDPVKVMPSNAQLIEILRAVFSRTSNPMEVGRQTVDDLTLGAAKMIEASRRDTFAGGSVFHLQFLDLTARPLDAVERLYRHFGLKLKAAARERMARHIAAKPNGGYARNNYTPHRHGIDPDDVTARFASYMSYFDIPRERAKQPVGARPRPVPVEENLRPSPEATATAGAAKEEAHSVR